MEKYTRIAIEVEAIQWYPRKELNIDGFQNIEETFFDQTGKQRVTVDKAEIVRIINDKEYKLQLDWGDWVLFMPNGGMTIVKDSDFQSSFFNSAHLKNVRDNGTDEQRAMFGITSPEIL